MRSFYCRLLQFFDHLAEGGRRFAYLISPGMREVDTHQGDVFMAIREWLLAALAERGVPAIDITDQTCDQHGRMREEFFSENPEDMMHGNEAWAALAIEACFREFGMVPADAALQEGR